MTNAIEFEYMNESTIDSELICLICSDPFDDPCCTPCNETFCRKCITQWLQKGNLSCPLCRATLSLEDLTEPVRIIRNMLAQLPVKCLSCRKKYIKRGDFADHIRCGCQNNATDLFSSLTSFSRSNSQSSQDFVPNSGQHIATRRQDITEISSAWIKFAVICIIVNIFVIFFHGYRAKKTSTFESVDDFNNEAVAVPLFCSKSNVHKTLSLPFENSTLLSIEQQTCLNQFYNETKSGIIGWKLIYKFAFCSRYHVSVTEFFFIDILEVLCMVSVVKLFIRFVTTKVKHLSCYLLLRVICSVVILM